MSLKSLIVDKGEPLFVSKQEHVFRQGALNQTLYWVKSGLLKAYYVSIDGKEGIKSFIQQGNIIGSLSSAGTGAPCPFSLVALEDCELLRIPFQVIMDATDESHEVANEVIQVLMSLSMRKEQREYEFLTLSAEERYVRLCGRAPELIQKLTQYDIARYLGITPVALSRIRKRIAESA